MALPTYPWVSLLFFLNHLISFLINNNGTEWNISKLQHLHINTQLFKAISNIKIHQNQPDSVTWKKKNPIMASSL